MGQQHDWQSSRFRFNAQHGHYDYHHAAEVGCLDASCSCRFSLAMFRVLSTLRDAFSDQFPQSGFMRRLRYRSNAAGLALYTLGSRRVPAAEATLIASLEVPLTPFWVWLAFGEVVSLSTLIGGAFVLSALVGHILIANRPFATPIIQ
jgi:hypothetical protein